MKPVIGILGSYDTEKKRYYLNQQYMSSISLSGGLPIMMPYVEDIDMARSLLSHVDGLLLAGGNDIDPKCYNEEKLPECGSIIPARDISEKFFVEALKETSLPFLGICRGIQTLNVFFGGTLYQDIPSQIGQNVGHSGTRHTANVKKDSLLYKIVGKEVIDVNSSHHQSVKDCAPGVSVAAVADDGIVESITFDERPNALGVQFHPELLFEESETARKLFAWLVEMGKNR